MNEWTPQTGEAVTHHAYPGSYRIVSVEWFAPKTMRGYWFVIAQTSGPEGPYQLAGPAHSFDRATQEAN